MCVCVAEYKHCFTFHCEFQKNSKFVKGMVPTILDSQDCTVVRSWTLDCMLLLYI